MQSNNPILTRVETYNDATEAMSIQGAIQKSVLLTVIAAVVGIALFLTHLAKENKTVSELRATYPAYFMGKKKIELTPEIDVDALLTKMQNEYQNEEVSTVDGVKIDFAENWVHLRKSNTEPIIRIYTEAKSQEEADHLGDEMIAKIRSLI